jgi:hypothetical protein
MENPSEDVYFTSSDVHVSIVGVAAHGTLYKWDEIQSVHLRKVTSEAGPSEIPAWTGRALGASLLILFIAGVWLLISLLERLFGANVSNILRFIRILLSAVEARRRGGKPEIEKVDVSEPHPLYIVSITTSEGPVEIVGSTAHWYVKRIAKAIKKARRESRLTLTGA